MPGNAQELILLLVLIFIREIIVKRWIAKVSIAAIALLTVVKLYQLGFTILARLKIQQFIKSKCNFSLME